MPAAITPAGGIWNMTPKLMVLCRPVNIDDSFSGQMSLFTTTSQAEKKKI